MFQLSDCKLFVYLKSNKYIAEIQMAVAIPRFAEKSLLYHVLILSLMLILGSSNSAANKDMMS